MEGLIISPDRQCLTGLIIGLNIIYIDHILTVGLSKLNKTSATVKCDIPAS